jgi:hypothetical protein
MLKIFLQHGVIPGSSQTKDGESALQEQDEVPHVASQGWRATMVHYVGLDVSLKQTLSSKLNGSVSAWFENVAPCRTTML